MNRRDVTQTNLIAWLLTLLFGSTILSPGCGDSPGSPASRPQVNNDSPANKDDEPSTKDSVSRQQQPIVETNAAIFVDGTSQAGIDFTHFNGTTGEYLLPEITGAGGALFDYDNDGDLDLYFVQGAVLIPPKTKSGGEAENAVDLRDRLYRNDGPAEKGKPPRFTDVTSESEIKAVGYGMGVATGDFNNDGWVDLYVTNLGANQLLLNDGDGTFTDATKAAGADDPRWSTSASFFDFDRDGWLDLYVANYVAFSLDNIPKCYSQSSARDFCGPDTYEPVPDRLLRNRGDGTFEDVTAKAGVAKTFGAGLGVVAADFNGDGWTDIYVANDGDPNQMWINQKNGSFEDQSLLAGSALNRMGQPEAGMGVDAADFDGDGDEDLFMTHLERESNTLYENRGDGRFLDRTIEVGLHASSLSKTAFGTRFLDYGNDGWLDLLVLNGHVRVIESLARAGDAYPLHQPNQLYRNTGKSSFVEVTKRSGTPFKDSDVSRGAAFGDVDNDGDVDVVVFNNKGPARLLLNQIGNRQHWLGLRLLDRAGKRDALQARAKIVSGSRNLWRRVHTDGSYCSASDARLLVGLGRQSKNVTVEVHWPDGTVETWKDVPIDRYNVLQQGNGA